MSHATDILFWTAAVLLFTIYAGYPLLVALLARLRRRPVFTPDPAAPAPRFSVLIAGFNEAANLPAKLDSLYASTAAPLLDEIIVGDDGSTDNTAAVLAGRAMSSLRTVIFPARRGKASVLNDLAPTCRSEILVFSDARQVVAPEAVAVLLDHFRDPSVAVVSGELCFVRDESDGGAAEGMGAYWAYEKWIRGNEAAFRGVPGASGALYAIRARLFRPIPADTLLDDVLIPLNAIRAGGRCLFAKGARVYDRPSASAVKEGIRKRRTLAGNLQLAARDPALLLPFARPLWFEFFFHKLLRLLSPFLLMILLAGSALRAGGSAFHAVSLAAQGAFYALAAAGRLAERRGARLPLAGPANLFVGLNANILLAWADFLRGRFTAAWDRSDKAPPDEAPTRS